jgi:hypothetical protein
LAQSELWLANHPDDNGYASALLARARARLLLNRDIAKAFTDCDGALRRLKKSPEALTSGLWRICGARRGSGRSTRPWP